MSVEALPYHNWYHDLAELMKEVVKASKKIHWVEKGVLEDIFEYNKKRYAACDNYFFENAKLLFEDIDLDQLNYWFRTYPNAIVELYSWRFYCNELRCLNKAL